MATGQERARDGFSVGWRNALSLGPRAIRDGVKGDLLPSFANLRIIRPPDIR